jgi:hypothetical protein
MSQEMLERFQEIDAKIKATPSPYSEDRFLIPEKFYLTNFEYETIGLIDEIETADLELYCIDASTGDKIIYPSQDYALFSVKNRILIVFYNYRTFTPKTYLYAEYKNKKETIQVYFYEDVQKFFHMGKDHSWGSFVFMGSRIVEPSDNNPSRLRCDINDYGPIFWNSQGETNSDGTHDEFSQTVDITRLQDFAIVMSVPSAGHIVYLRLKPINGVKIDNDYNNSSIVPAVTRTIFEIMKLIDEWAEVGKAPWNNTQAISLKAKEFIDGLNIPEEIMDSIRSQQTNMQVYRYLSGDENARNRPPLEEISLMPDVVYSWFKQQFCYRSFENLALYHPAFS